MTRVMVNGVFDCFHYWHLRHLQRAKEFGEVLIVSLTSDDAAERHKRKPIFAQGYREAMLRALAIVDEVVIVGSSLEGLKRTQPHVFVKGEEYLGKIRAADMRYCQMHNIRIAFTQKDGLHTSEIMQNYAAPRVEEEQGGIPCFRELRALKSSS